jgi:uncharacterized protein
MVEPQTALGRLEALLAGLEEAPVAVAVSGGVDSMTLSVVAGRVLGSRATMMHAVSPAVPASATARVRRYADREGWRLTLLDAGEFDDPRYRENPANRCFYCKESLYSAMRRATVGIMLSGTNLDDLDDYRPGLEAARRQGVRHPFVEARIDKSGVRGISRALGLEDLAELPAAPCLSSRIETGVRIQANLLAFVDRTERTIRESLAASVVRARVREDTIDIELDPDSLSRLRAEVRAKLVRQVDAMAMEEGIARPVRFTLYRRGSAFLRAASDG